MQCFDSLLSDVAQARLEPDFALYQAVIDYIETFLFRFHHPKEDQFIFPALRKRTQGCEALLVELERQHERGDVLLDGLRNALEVYQRNPGTRQRQEFEHAVNAYHDFEWQHMLKEERELFPLVEEHLMDEDWAEIDQVFGSHEDPLFGEEVQEEYQSLYQHIVDQYGDDWRHPAHTLV